MTLKTDIQKKSLEKVNGFVWGLAGTFTVLTLTLMFNGINAGRHIDDLIDIYVEGKRAGIQANHNFKKAVQNHNIIIEAMMADFKAIKSELKSTKTELNELKARVKHNTELAHRAHKVK